MCVMMSQHKFVGLNFQAAIIGLPQDKFKLSDPLFKGSGWGNWTYISVYQTTGF